MQNVLIILLCTFTVVVALGLQSLNVVQGQRLLAALTSLVISACNLALFKIVPQPTDFLETAAFLVGGPIGILVAMAIHPALVRSRLGRRPASPRLVAPGVALYRDIGGGCQSEPWPTGFSSGADPAAGVRMPGGPVCSSDHKQRNH